MIQSHVTEMDLTPVKTAAEAKFLAYLSPLSISFRMLYNTTESTKNLFSKNWVTMSDGVISMSRVPKFFPSNHNNEDSIQLKSLLVSEARGNHPISR